MKTPLRLAACSLGLVALAACATAAPSEAALSSAPGFAAPVRIADGSQLLSRADPAIRVSVPERAHYIGGYRWPLYDAVDAEMHVFVEADAYGLVEKFYWIQFESYLDAYPDASYDYPESNPETMALDGRTVHVRPGIMTAENPNAREGSDGEHFRRLIAEAGYRLPTYMANVRFVELFEPTHRKELMIIYGENMDAALTQMGMAQMQGAQSFAFADLDAPLIARADARIDLLPLD